MRTLALLTCFPLLLPTRSLAQAPFCKAVAAQIENSAAHWGVSVTRLDGTPLCSLNASQLFRPASNAKLFTTITALSLFGPAQTFGTEVRVDEAPSPNLHGDLTLAGGGDAYLSTRPMPFRANGNEPSGGSPVPDPLAILADQVAASGIRHITGSVVGDDTVWPAEPYGRDWAVDDLLWGYGAPVSALSYEDNKLLFTLTAGATIADRPPFTVQPGLPFYHVDLQARTAGAGTPDTIRLARAPGSRTLSVIGTLAIGSVDKEDLAIEEPALYAAQTLQALLTERGIVIDGAARSVHRAPATAESFEHQVNQPLALPTAPASWQTAATPSHPLGGADATNVIARHSSPALIEDVTVTLKVSQNLHAELLLRLLGQHFANEGSAAQGARVVHQFVAGAGVASQDFILYDGSGLSPQDLVTPRAVTAILAYAGRQSWFPAFKAALPVAGLDGTLAGRFAGALKGKVFAKTGTLGESRALSGFLTGASRQTVIFSILVDDHLPNSNADRMLTDGIVARIAAAN